MNATWKGKYKMKILHSADWHIGNYSGPEKDGQNLRALDTLRCIDHLVEVAKKENPDVVIVAGDIFHDAKVWASRGLSEVNTASKAIEELSKKSYVVVMRGTPNHDGKEQFEVLKERFKKSYKVRIVTEPEIVTIPNFGDWGEITLRGEMTPDTDIVCVPGFERGEYRAKNPPVSKEEENEIFTQYLGDVILGQRAQCNSGGHTILVSHYTVIGADTESGQSQFMSLSEPVIKPETLDAANFDLVALGHIHKPQQILQTWNAFYSGSINANNFNDEGQKRGFWIHELEPDGGRVSLFMETPYRKFLTLHLDDDKVSDINNGQVDEVVTAFPIKDCVTRVKYSCTEGNAKALNKALLEKTLLKKGAFWVSEISPHKIEMTANREVIEKADPVGNLKEWLKEKAMTPERIDKIVETAVPIIQEALATMKTGRLSGVFEPVEISVENYRNYEQETFNFKDISFCTINGRNGAGKSSLFMDAILDCLYEEPREGELTGWIRADEKARKGAITFTFKVGEDKYRVARTRSKSGKATLNLAEYSDGEWKNRSAEKMKDTQEEIISVVGMDSLTFRSCALIMQDQYGLFLQADKEKRVQVLSNILGLGMYEEMESRTRVALTETNREITTLKGQVTALAESCEDEETLAEGLKKATGLEVYHSHLLQTAQEGKDSALKELSLIEANKSRLEEIEKEVQKVNGEVGAITMKKMELSAKMEENKKSIDLIPLAEEKVKLHESLEEKLKGLLENKTKHDEIVEKVNEKQTTSSELMKSREPLATRIYEYQSKLATLQETLNDNTLESSYKEWELTKNTLDSQIEKQKEHHDKEQQVTLLRAESKDLENSFEREYQSRCNHLKSLQSKMDLLKDCQCIDIEKATCSFLADAKKSELEYNPLLEECKQWKEEKSVQLEEAKAMLQQAEKELADVDYNPREIDTLRQRIARLEKKATDFLSLKGVQEQHETLTKVLNETTESFGEYSEKIQVIEMETAELVKLQGELADGMIGIAQVEGELSGLSGWVDFQKQIPMLQMEKANLEFNETDINTELSNKMKSLSELKEKGVEFGSLINNYGEIKSKYDEAVQKVELETKESAEIQGMLGALKERHKAVEQNKEERKQLEKGISRESEKSAVLDVLKGAFSQDGVPHNIIKSLLPYITEIANNILGQMTGGKMGIEFKTEKILKSNNKKEVVTLDILIEEYGKPPLPYNSKSGGEKVKSALSAILALAETKSSSAGIQLGMLFIDEPPFLDNDGVEAYCDALVTICERYPDIKIMAITHDPAMKARFPQNLDVVKTDSGSKVQMV